ncbi:MAG: DUF3141 domain-containing protein [Rhodanobacteraceae bacterium]
MVANTENAAAGSSGELVNPWLLATAAADYAVDAWQRTLLYADIRRQRGNQYREHLAEARPNVLNFPAELVMAGADLPRPVNYGLMRIVPGPDAPVDETRRPFIVVDPRAGHGPGIAGFKPDSEIGAALRAGHPCYFVGFLPDPVPGQTVEDVMRAEAAFVRKVAELHPKSWGKPAVIGNCQAGWQVLMTAAVWPELFGPIIVAGAPVSYWAGTNPMRYLGGLLGGSWLTALTSDLGAGRFDGAWLVENFENLNPANTLWGKQYKVYSEVDTEGPRYLEFEKYWGGHVFLGAEEIQYIVDNLFIGNKLATAELSTSDGVRIDLRNIRSPIVVFCSYGDNISPPGQALGWITDLYRDDPDVAAHGQTIVYATHESIGHLGIFVSGSIGRREHREFTANIDIIDLLPPGIFRAEVKDHPDGVPAGELMDKQYLMSIRGSGIDEIRGIVKPDQVSERRFAAEARVSDINLALYRNLWQPWVRALSTPSSAHWLEVFQPVRFGFEWWSDRHPLAPLVRDAATRVREHRVQLAPDNPFLQMQTQFSNTIVDVLNTYRDARDGAAAWWFNALYGSPWMRALAGQGLSDDARARPHPGESPEAHAYMQHELAQLDASVDEGGFHEALVRSLFYLIHARGEANGRDFRHIWRIVRVRLGDVVADESAFRRLARRQTLLVQRRPEAAIAAIPKLLVDVPAETIRGGITATEELATCCGGLSDEEKQRQRQVVALFEQALSQKPASTRAGAPKAAARARSTAPSKKRKAATTATRQRPRNRRAHAKPKR